MKNQAPYPYIEEASLVFNGVSPISKKRLKEYLVEALGYIERWENRDKEEILKLSNEINVPNYLMKTDYYINKIRQNQNKIENINKHLNKITLHRQLIQDYIKQDDYKYETLIQLPCFRRWL